MKNTALAVLIAMFVHTVTAASALSEKELKDITTQFVNAKNARQQPQSNEQDVEHFLSFIADEFTDEHVKFKVTITDKNELRKGMIAKLADDIHFSNIDILDMMVGRNVVFVKFREHAKGQPSHLDAPIEYTAINIMSLEFDDKGKITHIRRHHGL